MSRELVLGWGLMVALVFALPSGAWGRAGDRVIARPEVDYPDEWSTRLPISRGRVYARAKRLLDPRFGICGAAVSRPVALR